MNRVVRVLVPAPVVLLAAVFLVTLTLSARGDHPLWRTEALNLSEAAALRDLGEVARLLAAGADPRAPLPVRGGFLYQEPATLTPADTAVLADRSEVLQLLVDYGLWLDPAQWTRAWCNARSKDVRDVLEQVRPDGTVPVCAPVR
jgi:hypothetical protein